MAELCGFALSSGKCMSRAQNKTPYSTKPRSLSWSIKSHYMEDFKGRPGVEFTKKVKNARNCAWAGCTAAGTGPCFPGVLGQIQDQNNFYYGWNICFPKRFQWRTRHLLSRERSCGPAKLEEILESVAWKNHGSNRDLLGENLECIHRLTKIQG